MHEKLDIKDLKRLLSNITNQLEHEQDRTKINQIVEALIKEVTGTEFASLWIFHQESATLRRERDDNTLKELSMLGQKGILAKCFFTLSSGIYNYIASEKGYVPEVDNPDNIKIKSQLIVPIIDQDQFLGMVTAYASVKKIKNFDQEDMELLQAIVPFLSKVIYQMYPEKQRILPKSVAHERPLRIASEQIVERAEKIRQAPVEIAPDSMIGFLANTVHDIRTPANTLHGFLELLEEKLDDPRILQYVKNAKESAQFINELTTSILDNLSSPKEQQVSKPQQVSPTKFFADIAEGFSANMSSKSIQYNIYIDPFIPKEVLLDTTLLKRVLMNLLNNAYKFTPSQKSVNFMVKYIAMNHQLSISVTDTGIGIAKEKQSEIFQAFTQAEEETKATYGGTGLGLSICADYVKKLGGELKLKSELDKGSSFYFTIPVEVSQMTPMFKPSQTAHIKLGIMMDREDVESSKNILRYLSKFGLKKENLSILMKGKQPTSDLTHLICFEKLWKEQTLTYHQQRQIPVIVIERSFLSMNSSIISDNISIISQYTYYAPELYKFISVNTPKRVLIVDDDRINVELIKAILSEEFYQIDTAKDGEEALGLLKHALDTQSPYTLAFLDQHMPKLTGTEVLQAFRRHERAKKTKPLFAVSISGDVTQEQEKGLFNSRIGKPFSKKRIKEVLEEGC